MGNISRKAALGVAAALAAATTATVGGEVAGASTVTTTTQASRAVVAALAAPTAPARATAAGSAVSVAAPMAAAPANCLGAGLTWPLTSRGATGERVYSIQQFLNQRINAGLTVDSNFGPLTEAAVRRFQTSVGLPADGQVGQNTWPRLCIGVSRGATGPAVFALQHNLHYAYGFTDLAIDGDFGPATENAVRIFQMVERITVDGIAGPVTWNRIIAHEM
ncbi:MAG TPA: peptidoglycan-binding protein [Trebonia sp.]|nr:peptidoglycan-binding protein [Trebonia sp.]